MDHRAPLGYNGRQVHPAVARNSLLGGLSDEDFGLLQPAVLALGWIAVVLHKRGAHHDRHTPAE